MGAGAIWIPVVDFLAVSAIQLDMVRQICAVYGQDFKESQGKAMLSALTGSGLSRLAARAIKFIPGIGTILGGIAMSVLSGASTYAIGELFKRHFENGGTILDFDVESLKSKYDELFEKGKEYAQNLRKEKESETPEARTEEKYSNQNASSNSTRSAIEQLKDLAELKEKGLINEEEYNTFKKKIMDM